MCGLQAAYLLNFSIDDCIFAELLHRRPFLQGSSDIDQLGKIFAAFGTPKQSQWPNVVYLPDYVEYQYVPAPPLRSLFPIASDDALDLLSRMLTYDPKARITSQQALEHRFFSSVPAPTKPALLPRPRKGESLNNKPSDFNPQDGPIVLSPPRKSRRVTLRQDGLEHLEKVDENVKGVGQVGEATGARGNMPVSGPSGNMPMSIDLGAVFETHPVPRPKLNR